MRLLKWILILPLFLGLTHASEVLINTEDGYTYVFDVDPEESLSMLQDRISALTENEDFIVVVPSRGKKWALQATKNGGYLGYPRDYTAEMTQQERDDIHFIVTSLADKSIITIAFIKGDLESAGDRIDHVHPLRFLKLVFTSDEMIVGIRNIRGRGWIWNQFIGGIKNSLATEMDIDNLKDEFILRFAQDVKVDVNRIYPSIHAQDWGGFIEILINEISRKGDYDRYDEN